MKHSALTASSTALCVPHLIRTQAYQAGFTNNRAPQRAGVMPVYMHTIHASPTTAASIPILSGRNPEGRQHTYESCSLYTVLSFISAPGFLHILNLFGVFVVTVGLPGWGDAHPHLRGKLDETAKHHQKAHERAFHTSGCVGQGFEYGAVPLQASPAPVEHPPG